jgi:hypothetical protein
MKNIYVSEWPLLSNDLSSHLMTCRNVSRYVMTLAIYVASLLLNFINI